eukprot:2832407-Rhodomonas_salina.1
MLGPAIRPEPAPRRGPRVADARHGAGDAERGHGARVAEEDRGARVVTVLVPLLSLLPSPLSLRRRQPPRALTLKLLRHLLLLFLL